jgi:hypothetical protein
MTRPVLNFLDFVPLYFWTAVLLIGIAHNVNHRPESNHCLEKFDIFFRNVGVLIPFIFYAFRFLLQRSTKVTLQKTTRGTAKDRSLPKNSQLTIFFENLETKYFKLYLFITCLRYLVYLLFSSFGISWADHILLGMAVSSIVSKRNASFVSFPFNTVYSKKDLKE